MYMVFLTTAITKYYQHPSHKHRGTSLQGNISKQPQLCQDGGAPDEEAIIWCLYWLWSSEKGEEPSISFS